MTRMVMSIIYSSFIPVLLVLMTGGFASYASAVDSATTIYEQGLAHIDAERYDDAIESFSEAIRLDPAFASAYLYRGILRKAFGDKQTAIEDFDAAIRIDPINAAAFNQRGEAYDRLNNTKAAIADFNAALNIDPNLDDAYYNRGLAYYRANGWQQAIDDFTIAIGFDPENADAFYYRGRAKWDRDASDDAFDDVGEAIRLEPGHAPYYLWRARILALLASFGNVPYDRPMADLESVLAFDPDNTGALRSQAAIYSLMCRYEEAVQTMERAIRLAEKNNEKRVAKMKWELSLYSDGPDARCVESDQ